MSWNRERIDGVAIASAPEDYAAFEAIGLSEMREACVLDAGCFDGFNTVLKFAPYGNIVKVVGIDPAASALEIAANRTDDPRFEWVASDCETFDGAGESFDVVYFSHVFQHLADKEAGLRNVFRLLKPGGFVVIKTVDDSNKMSYPDPDGVMRRLFALYEQYTLPNTPHTQHTDRNNGSKCYTLLKHAGFANIAVRTTLADTSGKSLDERRALFERCTYFRKHVPEGTDPEIAQKIRSLLDAWQAMFECDDYYYASTTFVVLAQKPDPEAPPTPYRGPLFESPANPFAEGKPAHSPVEGEQCESGTNPREDRAEWALVPMVENDLGDIMHIELKSFPDPWTPIAYAMELRYNAQGTYLVAKNAAGTIGGYVGWWEANQVATIANIAVDPDLRRHGIGKMLIEGACSESSSHGCVAMHLQVRAKNANARAFYAAMGFSEHSTSCNYYTNPDDDAIILVKML